MHDDDSLAVEVNRLYWDSNTSIADITSQLEISRRALYDLIRPDAATSTCASCSSTHVFSNRSARDRGEAVCPACDLQLDDYDGAELPPTVEQEWTAAGMSPIGTSEAMERNRAVMMGGAAIAGIVLGAAATWLVARKD